MEVINHFFLNYIKNIYVSATAILAITNDETIHTWGLPVGGGNFLYKLVNNKVINIVSFIYGFIIYTKNNEIIIISYSKLIQYFNINKILCI